MATADADGRTPGRTVDEVAALLADAPAPDPDFAADMSAVFASVGSAPEDPWDRS